MKHFTREEIDNSHHLKRANLINSSTGYKPANLIGTISVSGATNLAILSPVVQLILPENSVLENGSVDLNCVKDVCTSGLDTYHEVTKFATFRCPQTANLPTFDI